MTLLSKIFKEYAKTHHPDKGGDAEKFKEINEAKETITQYLELKKCITTSQKIGGKNIYTTVLEPSITGMGTAQSPFVAGTYKTEAYEIDSTNFYRVVKAKGNEQAK
jgi:hypothetical protein